MASPPSEPAGSAAGPRLRYAFLWSNEQVAGATEGAKGRPCAIIVAARSDANGDMQTIVAPITHRPHVHRLVPLTPVALQSGR